MGHVHSAAFTKALSARIADMAEKFGELERAGSGLTRDDIERVGRNMREFVREARELEGRQPTTIVNDAVPSAYRMLDQAERLATLNNWTPKRAHSFAKRRLAKIETLLEEIAYVYYGVDDGIDTRCTEAREGDIKAVREAIDYALESGAEL